MKNKLLTLLAAIVVSAAIFALVITREGSLVTPQGSGIVTLDSGKFEAFPLPEYAASLISSDYKSYFIEVEPGIKIHVLEVGAGLPVYLQHGNPTSGFLYRKIVDQLPKDKLRMIMPTMVGLGFSSKIPASQHTLDNHTRWMNSVLTQLKLTDVIYVGQDWGGPVGMGALAQSPELLKGAVLLNTGFNAPTEKMELSSAHAAVKSPVIGEVMTEVITTIFEQLPRMQGDPNSMPAEVLQVYAKPVNDSGNAKAPLTLMRMVTDGPDHPSASGLRTIEAYVKSLDIPAEIVWGINDPILGRALPMMKQNFPKAPVTETQGGHFLQEEVPGDIAAALLRVVDQVQGVKKAAN